MCVCVYYLPLLYLQLSPTLPCPRVSMIAGSLCFFFHTKSFLLGPSVLWSHPLLVDFRVCCTTVTLGLAILALVGWRHCVLGFIYSSFLIYSHMLLELSCLITSTSATKEVLDYSSDRQKEMKHNPCPEGFKAE